MPMHYTFLLYAFLCYFAPSGLLAVDRGGDKDAADVTASWFVFIGGSEEKPIWTVSKGVRHHDLPPLFAGQIASLVPIIESTLGVQSIVFSSTLPNRPRKTTPEDDENINPDAPPEYLVNVMLRAITNRFDVPHSLALDLQVPVKSVFDEGYLSGYSETPPVLCLRAQPLDANIRLLTLTRQLVNIALRVTDGDNRRVKYDPVLHLDSTAKEIESVWRDQILKPYELSPTHLKVWKSLSMIEIHFATDVPFAEWAEVLAGKKLGSSSGGQ